MPALAESVLLGEAAGTFVLVIHDDDHVIRSESRGLLDQWHLALQESVEVGVSIVDWPTVRFTVFTAIRDDEIEVRDLSARQGLMEEVHGVLPVAGGYIVLQAFLRRIGGRPDAVRPLNVVEISGRISGRVETGQGASRV